MGERDRKGSEKFQRMGAMRQSEVGKNERLGD